jgi:uncharacterized glyoxalase superfamily protein PhnB
MEEIELKAIPTLRVLDYKEAMSFYIDFLGFSLDWEHRFGPEAPVYMQVSYKGLVLHLTENERFNTGMVVFVETRGIDSFHQKLSGKQSGLYIPAVKPTPWETRQMEVEDPFGNVLRFNEVVADERKA